MTMYMKTMVATGFLLAMFGLNGLQAPHIGSVACADEQQGAVEQGAEALRRLPVQDGGRLKPYDSFARETLQLIYGKQTYEGRPAVEIVTTWMLAPQIWEERKFIEVRHGGVKDALHLPKTEKYFSPAEIFKSDRLSLVFQELQAKVASKKKLNPYDQAAQRLENQLGLFHMIRNAQAPRVVPAKEGDKWRAVGELDGELRERFIDITKAFITALPQTANAPSGEAERSVSGGVQLSEAVQRFTTLAQAENPVSYADSKMMAVEVHYNGLHPFMWTWILYLVAALLLSVAWYGGNRGVYVAGWVFAVLAFALHIYGFALRVYLTGRPPVSNMYESVVWVSFGAVLFSMIFEAIGRKRFVLLGGALTGILCLITADMAPAVLDKSLHPLEPVLRSTLWLTVHVLTITISYSAFFLAWCLSMFGLSYVFRGFKPTDERVRDVAQSCYRSLQVGVVLLAAGTILGGVWADYSWGRFWGWDPKETWALIALLGYLALLHARLIGWVQNFGLMAGSIVAFSLVIMAWYGVNFVLGAGLHSYGWGAGGIEYVSAFVALNFLYVGYVAYLRSASFAATRES